MTAGTRTLECREELEPMEEAREVTMLRVVITWERRGGVGRGEEGERRGGVGRGRGEEGWGEEGERRGGGEEGRGRGGVGRGRGEEGWGGERRGRREERGGNIS